MVYAYHASYERSVNKNVEVQAGSGINVRPYLKNNKSKKGSGHISNSKNT
jgi:hypothetical protein